MKKFGMLMVMVSLLGYSVGCGGAADEEVTPVEPAPSADTDTLDDTTTDDTVTETPAE